MSKIVDKLISFAKETYDDVLMYVALVVGVLFSKYLPAIVDSFIFDKPLNFWFPSHWQLYAACVIGGFIAVQMDGKGNPIGKKANLKRRLNYYFSQGYLWQGVIGTFSDKVKDATNKVVSMIQDRLV